MELLLSYFRNFRKVRCDCRLRIALVIVHLLGAYVVSAETFVPTWSHPTRTFNFRQEIAASALDPAGNIAVAGAAVENTYTSRGVYVAKRRLSDGELIWGVTHEFERTVQAIAVDGLGNFLVLTIAQDLVGYRDHLTISKFAATDGQIVWQRSFDSRSHYRRPSLAVDAQGNVILASFAENSDGPAPEDLFIGKYASADGNPQWEQRYDGVHQQNDFATAVAVDSHGFIVVAGESTVPNGDSGLRVLKVSPEDGNKIWDHDEPESGIHPSAIVLDAEGNPIIAGTIPAQSSIGTDFYIGKFAAGNGALIWERTHHGSNESGNDAAKAVAVDHHGDVIVTGATASLDQGLDVYTAKYSASDGDLLWEHLYDYPKGLASYTSRNDDFGIGLAVDSSDDVVITAQTTDQFVFDGVARYYVAKYEGGDGSLKWQKILGFERFRVPSPYSPLITPDGGIVTTEWSGLITKYSRLVDPASTVLYASGDEIRYDDGRDQPFVSVWRTFGPPTINDAGDVAFRGQWQDGPRRGTGILFDGRVVAQVGGPAFGLNQMQLRSLTDPLIDSYGNFVVLATLMGRRVTLDTDAAAVTGQVVPYVTSSMMRLIGREDGFAPGSAEWASFRAIALTSDSTSSPRVVLEGKLRRGPGNSAVTSSNDSVVVTQDGTEGGGLGVIALREGERVDGLAPGETVRSWKLFSAPSTSLGQGRSFGPGGDLIFTATLNTGGQALLRIHHSQTKAFVRTGSELHSTELPGATWINLGPVAATKDGLAVLGVAKLSSGEQVSGIFEGDIEGAAWEPVALAGSDAPGITGAKFRDFQQPVLSPRVGGGSAKVAFLARTTGSGQSANRLSLWVKSTDGPLTFVAQEGTAAAESPGDIWTSFRSIAIPGGEIGPLLQATIRSATGKGKEQMGVWAVDSFGNLRLLFRQGSEIEGRTLTGFTALGAVRGSPGVTRAFNNYSELVWSARFQGGTQAVVRTTVP